MSRLTRGAITYFALLAMGISALLRSSGPAVAGAAGSPTPSPDPIKHVVIIIQENRTVDNLFNGFPGADTVTSGTAHDGSTIALQPVSLSNETDICHSHPCWVKTYDGGKLDGFDLISPRSMGRTYPYSYVPQSETMPYWTMA